MRAYVAENSPINLFIKNSALCQTLVTYFKIDKKYFGQNTKAVQISMCVFGGVVTSSAHDFSMHAKIGETACCMIIAEVVTLSVAKHCP